MMKTSPCQAIELGTCHARLAVEAGERKLNAPRDLQSVVDGSMGPERSKM